jgi:NAD+ kinase
VIRLGVVGHRGYDGLAEVLRCLLRVAPALGIEPHFESDLHEIAGEGQRLTDPDALDRLDALLTLGGDGTMLRGARLLEGRQIPVLGVNLGRLGFLTGIGADEFESALHRFAAGEFRAEERMALEARAVGPDGVERRRWQALNDVVLHKGGFARVVRLRVAANGESVGAYAADGIVISTPTGSTAYNLSAGGPIVVPTVESLLLTAISPHTLAVRPLVLPPSAEITVQADDGPEELLVTVDGQVGTTFASGELLTVKRALRPVLIVRFPGTTFFARMRRKLGWGGLIEQDDLSGPC